MPQALSYPDTNHPAPQREPTRQTLVWLSIVAAPLAWSARLLVNYTIAGQHCTGAANIGAQALPNGRIATILLIDLIAVLLAVIAGSIAYRQWREKRTDSARFLAMCGMLTSTLFGVAIVIDAIGTIVGPPC